LVFEREGVTRDYLRESISWNGKDFDFIDAGGFTFKKGDSRDPFADVILNKVELLISQASLLLFVCDVKSGLVEEDLRIAKILRRTNKNIFLILNKIDNKSAYEDTLPDFYSLGFDKIFPVSALHGLGFGDLLTAIAEDIESEPEKQDEFADFKVVLLGKPNVGKSSLMNLLIKQERSIISPIAGTTRESISERISFEKGTIEITDTPGIRRRGRIDDDLEEIMVKNSFSSVRDADVIIFIVDSSEGTLCNQELNLLFYAYEQKKSILIVFNKLDLLNCNEDCYLKDRLKYNLEQYSFILKKIPQVWISCKNEQGVEKVMKEISKISKRLQKTLDAIEVDEFVKDRLIKNPIYKKNELLEVYNIKPIPARIPTFVVKVSDPVHFEESHLNYIENILREKYDFLGCPINLIIRG